jgi:hypothetical protein
MSLFLKKFEALLEESDKFKKLSDQVSEIKSNVPSNSNPDTKVLQEKIEAVEKQISIIVDTTRTLMLTITELVRGHTTNRKAIEELYNFVTDPNHENDTDGEHTESVSNEEVEAYKKTLN